MTSFVLEKGMPDRFTSHARAWGSMALSYMMSCTHDIKMSMMLTSPVSRVLLQYKSARPNLFYSIATNRILEYIKHVENWQLRYRVLRG